MTVRGERDTIMLLREAVAAILCRGINDPVVVSIAVALHHSAEKCEMVLTVTGFGTATMYFSRREYENTAVGLTYPSPRLPRSP